MATTGATGGNSGGRAHAAPGDIEADVVILGGGPAGEHAVGRCHDAGLSAALVEQELVGGECSYWACTPSKTLLRPGQVLAAARDVPGAAEAVTGALDVEAALARRNWMTSDWNDSGQLTWLAGQKAVLVRGHGRLAGERVVEVTTPDGELRRVRARRAVIVATGSEPAMPPIPGLAETAHWDNRGATSAQEIPARLAVLGGGPVGVELAQAFRRLGSREVTVVEAADRLLPGQEPFAGEEVAAAFAAEGIEVLTSAKATAVERISPPGNGGSSGGSGSGSAGEIRLTVTTAGKGPDGAAGGAADTGDGGDGDGGGAAGGSGMRTIVADQLLVATGRRPKTKDIGAETVGCTPGAPLPVDDRLRVTTVPEGWLYAVGDVNGRALLTHMAKYQARVAVDTIAGGRLRNEVDDRGAPGVVFTDPQVASVGLTEAAAEAAGLRVRCVRIPLSDVGASSIVAAHVRGAAQLVVEEPSGRLVGATFVGPDAGEILQSATIAVTGEMTIEQLRHAVAAFPTLSELWLELTLAYLRLRAA
ncbi:MAG TPA: NAD(P)/FAD-dependent oxidoreductase [Acidimicrobiales bacterium]|nr:NAD(P)/FAD-dependent oxidoreductase [Acidimicrobiales bacterium]